MNSKKVKGLKVISVIFVILASHFYLQLTQNDFSWHLASKFVFEWHTEKFLLGSLVLLGVWLVIKGLIVDFRWSLCIYTVSLLLLGFANYQKMAYRMEPLYPDDLKMLGQLSVIKDLVGLKLAIAGLLLVVFFVVGSIWYIYKSLSIGRTKQLWRLLCMGCGLVILGYASDFNNPANTLRQAYNRTAKWIPYSQEMNYYNTGFVGGFLYNLKVEPMTKPKGYSKERMAQVVSKYKPTKQLHLTEEAPNIVYVMSESFSDPSHLKGLSFSRDTLKPYKEVAKANYSGQMLSQNYGGGTANIEFEALTGLSLEPMNSQLTTPYTMLVPKLSFLPSIVSLLKDKGYEATAIHPYNTSMYKRQDVYRVLGFDQFLSEKTMKHHETIASNPYISDESAFSEVFDLLKTGQRHQFIHLVTMQTHMPYTTKYHPLNQEVTGVGNPSIVKNYLEDVGYTSQAFKTFIEKLKGLDRRTIVVFWGDHLPGIYEDSLKSKNTEEALHLTEFTIVDSEGKQESLGIPRYLSPIYFGPSIGKVLGGQLSGFYQLLTELEKNLPAFEKGHYLSNNHWTKELSLSKEAKEIYEDYTLISYDLIAGHQYSVNMDFYKE